jgi:hypothetical protein
MGANRWIPSMSVDHFLLPVSSAELDSLLNEPATIRDLVERRQAEVCELDADGLAIIALTSTGDGDPLAFMQDGAPDDVSGWIGKYVGDEKRVVHCEVDMGYGPASYYKNRFVREVARRLEQWTVDEFAANCDLDWLEENSVYPAGWLDEGRKEFLIEAFTKYRACILSAAESGQHLLVWCA